MKRQTFLILAVMGILFMAYAATSRRYYNEDHPILNEIRQRFMRMDVSYAKIPMKTGNESYTYAKSAITLCVINPETGRYYDINTLMYVALHELAHVFTKANGEDSHEDEFKGNFTYLLKQADMKGVYDPSKPIPKTYCGVGQESTI